MDPDRWPLAELRLRTPRLELRFPTERDLTALAHLAAAGNAVSAAFADNAASQAVSRRLGYAFDGTEVHVRRGEPATLQRFRLDHARWLDTHTVPVTIEGLEPCLPLFALTTAAVADG